jgi:hypothetical protein
MTRSSPTPILTWRGPGDFFRNVSEEIVDF